MNKYVSIIIPTYNRAATIEKSINSILNQTYEWFELIIVDDGSSDNTRDIVNGMGDARIKYVRQDNAGAGAARNTGVKNASYDIIAFHDSDDIWHADKLQKQMEYWENHKECQIIYCGFTLFCNDCRKIIAPVHGENDVLSGNILKTLVYKNMVSVTTILMEKAAFNDVGGFDTSLRCLEDWELALRIAEKYIFGFVDESLVDTFQTEGSVSTRTGEYYNVKCQLIIKYKDYLIANNIFDDVVMALFESASKAGVFETVKNMFMAYLQNSNR